MTHPTGEHASGVELASGYVKVDVRTSDGINQLHRDLDTVEAHGKTVGANTSKNIVEGIGGAGAPAAKALSDSLKDGTAKETPGIVQSFLRGIEQGVGQSKWGDEVFRPLVEGAKSGLDKQAPGIVASFIAGIRQGIADHRAEIASAADALTQNVGKSVDELKDKQLGLRQEILNMGTAYSQLRASGTADVASLTAAHDALIAKQTLAKQNAIDLAKAQRSAREDGGDEGRSAKDVLEGGTKANEALGKFGAGGEVGAGLLGVGPALAAIADPAVLATGGVLAIAGAVGVTLDKLYELGNKWEETFHSIQIQTGATGEQLTGLEDSVKRVAGNVPLAIGQVGSIVSTVATAFKDSGTGLDQVATEVGKLQSMVGQVDLTTLGRGFRAFGIGGDAQQQVAVLNELFKASQATQIPMDGLINTFTRAAQVAKEFHLGIGQTVAVMAQFDQAGINPASTIFTLSRAANEATKQHKDFTTVLADEIEQIRNAPGEQEQMQLATKFFGPTSGRGGAATIVGAINQGFSLDPAVLQQISQADGLIDKTRQDTMTWGDVWTETKNRISGALEPISQQLREHVQAGFEQIAAWLDAHQGQIVAFATGVVNAFEAIGGKISEVFREAIPVVKQVIDYLKPNIEAMMPSVDRLVKALGQDLLAAWRVLGPVAKATGEVLIFALNEVIKYAPPVINVVTDIAKALGDVLNWVSTNFSPIWHTAFDDAKAVIAAVTPPIRDVIGAVEAASGFVGKIVDIFVKLGEALGKVIDWLGKPAWDIFKTTMGLLWDVVSPLIDGFVKIDEKLAPIVEKIAKPEWRIFKDLIKDLGDAFKDAWTFIDKVVTRIDDMANAVSKIHLPDLHIPGIGRHGGAVAGVILPPGIPGVTGQSGLALHGYGGGDIVPAMLEPGEHVVTKEEIAGVGGHENMYVLRQLMRHGILREVLGFQQGGDIPLSPIADPNPGGGSGGMGDPWPVSGPGFLHQSLRDASARAVADASTTAWLGQMIATALGGKGDDPTWTLKQAFGAPGRIWQESHLGDATMWLNHLLGGHQSGGPISLASGGRVRPAGFPHREKSWVIDRYRMSEPGKTHFDTGGDVPPSAGGEPAALYVLQAESGRTPYQLGGFSGAGIDCSGLVSEVVNTYLGLPPLDSRMSTGSEASWLAAKGFVQGKGPAGTLRIGFYNGGEAGGHTALTLPSGVNAESGGSGGGVRLGGGAAGADNPEFTDHWYLPERTIVQPGGYGGTGSGGSGGYGGAGGSGGASGGGGSGSKAATPEQLSAANDKVTNLQGQLQVANDRIAEAEGREIKTTTAKGKERKPEEIAKEEAAKAADIKRLTEERDRIQGDVDQAASDRDDLTGSNTATLTEAQNRLADATHKLSDANTKLQEDQANPKIKPSQIQADQDAITRATEAQSRAQEHLQKVQDKPGKQHKESKEARDVDWVNAVGDAAGKGLIENLPQGFSDPTTWSVVKSGAALLKFAGGLAAGPGGSPTGGGVLNLFGDLLGGKGGGAAQDLAGLLGYGPSQAQPGYTAGGQPVAGNPEAPAAGPDASAGSNPVTINRNVTYTGDINDMATHKQATEAAGNRIINQTLKTQRLVYT